jgi:hypothetical protein
MFVRQFAQDGQFAVIVCVWIDIADFTSDVLERVDGDKVGIRMFREKIFNLLHQSISNAVSHYREMNVVRRVVGLSYSPRLDSLEAVLQTKIERCAASALVIPHVLAVRHFEAQPQRQP